MRYRARTDAVVTLLVTAAFFVCGGCATLVPPVDFTTATAPHISSLDLNVIEGRPDGLLLRLRLDETNEPEGHALQLLRADGAADAEVYRQIQLQKTLREALATDGVEFLDRNMVPGRTTRYQLRLVTEEGKAVAYSELLRVDWDKPPPRATGLEGRATTPATVELRWTSPQRGGAVIFRRNVLDEDSTPTRVGEVGPDSSGVFIDTGVEPGVVYAYRVSLASPHGDYLQLGPPSEPIYVDVPAR